MVIVTNRTIDYIFEIMVLLIIDPQIDFISGSLAVADGMRAMDWLTTYIEQHIPDIEHIVITMDQHPMDHCSFKPFGGMWPPHCIRYSPGASIYPPLFSMLMKVQDKVKSVLFIEKATSSEKDAYSAFESSVPEVLSEADRIMVGGIAGDFCVKASVEDLARHGLSDRLFLLNEAIAYINPPH
ncbi:nicotinamidase/pyrazinamidase [Porphyromonas macacae]|uniref:nicotinamidase n=2 Tax=Porphyromonas macacae TaxID=28115 RepID=A0A379DJR0_9PORP|nr:nicotinamidase/pyrazinamidase [Porphyromonas macacae]